MSLAALPSASSSASLASSRALRALVRLAEALGTPDSLAAALAEAKEAAAEAEEALEGLETALAVALTHTAQLPSPRGLEAQGMYRALRDMAAAHVRELEREMGRNLRRRRLLGVLRNVAVGLLLLCAPLREWGLGGRGRRGQWGAGGGNGSRWGSGGNSGEQQEPIGSHSSQ